MKKMSLLRGVTPLSLSSVVFYYLSASEIWPDKRDHYRREWLPGADPGFQVRGWYLKNLHRAEGGAKYFGVFRVKNHTFSNFRGGVCQMHPPGSGPGYCIMQ
jgi:hypothetical protein